MRRADLACDRPRSRPGVLRVPPDLVEWAPPARSVVVRLGRFLRTERRLREEDVRRCALHLGTFVAVLAYFWRDVVVYVREGDPTGVLASTADDRRGAAGLVLRPRYAPGRRRRRLVRRRDRHRARNPVDHRDLTDLLRSPARRGPTGWRGKRDLEEFKAPDALKVGIAQTLALNPGTSRSGITITAARWLGFNRDAAARISFVMSLPVIAGAVVVKSAGLFTGEIDSDLYIPMVVGIVTSGIVGVDRRVGNASFDPDPQLHALRDLPGRPRHLRAHPDRRRRARAARADAQSAPCPAAIACTVNAWNFAVSNATTRRASVSMITRCGESRNLLKLCRYSSSGCSSTRDSLA